MADLNAFQYRPGESLLHGFDPRAKLAAMVVIGLIGLSAPPSVLGLTVLLTAAALRRAGIGPRRWMCDMRPFWVLLLFVLIVRALDGGETVLLDMGRVSVTAEGLQEGALVSLRLIVVALAGVALAATTSPSQIEAAVQALLRPIPFLPERQAATMLALVVRFLPEVLHQARLTQEAQRARCAERRRNPVVRLSLLAVSLLRRVMIRADRLALAMEARCYSDRRTGPALAAGPRDGILLAALLALLLLPLL